MRNLICIFFILFFVPVFSQNESCSDFYVEAVYPDSIQSSIQHVSINFNGDSSIYINYPLVSALVDCNGDTFAIGNLFYFAQFGQSIQDYPVTLSGTLGCMPWTVLFSYGIAGFDDDTCVLSYGTNDLGYSRKEQFFVFPNPTNDGIIIKFSDPILETNYKLLDQFGRYIQEGEISGKDFYFDMSIFNSGIYFLYVEGKGVIKISKIR